MVDAIRKVKTQPLPKAAAPSGAARELPAPAPPASARDRLEVGPAARAEAEKAEAALKLLGQEPPDKVPQTTTPVELKSTNKVTATWSSKAQQLEDRRRLIANRTREADTLAALGPARQQQYDAVRELIKHDPSAELALQTMLLNDQTPQLTGVNDLDGEQDLLGHLHRIATQQNAHGVHPRELLRTLVRELERPNAISQGDGDIGTCVATTATIAAATANPAEIARLVAGLASEAGTVTLHGVPGEARPPTLTRPANWNKDTKGFGGDRSPSVRLLQPALMNYALKTALEAKADVLRRDYGLRPDEIHLMFDPRTDAYTPSGGKDTAANGGRDIAIWKELNSGGLDTDQGNRLLEHLTGRPYQPLEVNDRNRDEAFARIRAAAEAGHMVPVGVAYKEKQGDGTWHEGGHQMMIKDVGPKGFRVIDPIEGTLHTWSAAKLKAAVTDANLPVARMR